MTIGDWSELPESEWWRIEWPVTGSPRPTGFVDMSSLDPSGTCWVTRLEFVYDDEKPPGWVPVDNSPDGMFDPRAEDQS